MPRNGYKMALIDILRNPNALSKCISMLGICQKKNDLRNYVKREPKSTSILRPGLPGMDWVYPGCKKGNTYEVCSENGLSYCENSSPDDRENCFNEICQCEKIMRCEKCFSVYCDDCRSEFGCPTQCVQFNYAFAPADGAVTEDIRMSISINAAEKEVREAEKNLEKSMKTLVQKKLALEQAKQAKYQKDFPSL